MFMVLWWSFVRGVCVEKLFMMLCRHVSVVYQGALNYTVSQGIVYPFLKLLWEKGYVTFDFVSVGNKSRKVYTLTEAGRVFYELTFAKFQEVYIATYNDIDSIFWQPPI